MEKKTALVIGASGDIGFETVKVLHEKGFEVLSSFRSNDVKLKRRLKECGLNTIPIYQLDVRDILSMKNGIKRIIENHKKIDVVVYSVTPEVVNKRFKDLQWSDFQEHIDVGIKGFFNTVKSLYTFITSKQKIKFIGVLTECCIGKPPSMLSHYTTSKYGTMGLMKSLASELSKYNCTFNMVSPSMVNSSLSLKLPSKLVELTAFKNPMKRLAEPFDVANVIAFLSSDESDYLNGVNIPVNGGNIFI